MDAFKRVFTLRKKKNTDKNLVENTTTAKPHQWNDDEKKVREGNCSFQVKYLGSIEVFESRGMAVCEEAMKELLKPKIKRKSKRAVLYVSGDALRVTEEISKGLIVDQVIEKVSFCAPVRNHNRGFAYICRDATTRRWLCHGFKAVKETGERLSHAVGCAFAVCLEKKQQREKDSVDVTFNENKTSFTRYGSFKQAPIIDRWRDPQSVIIPEPLPSQSESVRDPEAAGAAALSPSSTSGPTSVAAKNKNSVPRPHASLSALERQSSLRIFPKLQEQITPFKRDYSVRIVDQAITKERKQQQSSWMGNGTNSIKEDLELGSGGDHARLANPSTFSNGVSKSNTNNLFEKNNSFDHNNNNNSSSETGQTETAISNNPFSTPSADPFSAAPLNPVIHLVKTQMMNETSPISTPFQRPNYSNVTPNHGFYSSMRPANSGPSYPTLPNRPANMYASYNVNHHHPVAQQSAVVNGSNNASISVNWMPNAPNDSGLVKNPFDVSWVNNRSNSSTKHNPFV